jgi:hypothetical protein
MYPRRRCVDRFTINILIVQSDHQTQSYTQDAYKEEEETEKLPLQT